MVRGTGVLSGAEKDGDIVPKPKNRSKIRFFIRISFVSKFSPR
jgi:hypothetical protein